MITLTLFLLSFALLGGDMFLLLFHLSAYPQVTNSTLTAAAIPAGSILLNTEMYLFMAGVIILIYAFIRGADLPEGPVTGSETDATALLGQIIAKSRNLQPPNLAVPSSTGVENSKTTEQYKQKQPDEIS